MPIGVEKLARKFMRNPSVIQIGESGNKLIEQRIEFVTEKDKKNKLLELLNMEFNPPMILFVNAKKAADAIAKILDMQGYKVMSMHGGKMGADRKDNMEGFKTGKYDILVATDIAGRGLDVEGLQHVINFDMAKNIEDYTHRIGRTGRAGNTGIATTFLTPEDSDKYFDLKEYMIKCNQMVPHELMHHPSARFKPDAGNGWGKIKGGGKGVIFAGE